MDYRNFKNNFTRAASIALILIQVQTATADPQDNHNSSPVNGGADAAKNRTVDLSGVVTGLTGATRTAAVGGVCSSEIADAGDFLKDLIFYKSSETYKSGDAGKVWGDNEGINKYFSDMQSKSPQMQEAMERFGKRIKQLDTEKPIPTELKTEKGAHLDSRATYNSYEEALKIADGNVFRAVQMVGMVGSDDIFLQSQYSSLYAPGSIGPLVDEKTMSNMKKAAKQCKESGAVCAGANAALNYHMNFGFFLGCERVKHGFNKAQANKVFADSTSESVLKDPFIKRDLSCRGTAGIGPFCQYQFNLCTDIPKMLGYYYKKTTMANWLSKDARYLYEHGYNEPFLSEKAGNTVAFPADWDEPRRKAATGNLDYRLMHLEYGSRQAEVGAKKGAEVCQAYKDSLAPKGLGKVAEQLYGNGNFDPSASPDKLKRVPASLVKKPEVLNSAWKDLRADLVKKQGSFGFDAGEKEYTQEESVMRALTPGPSDSLLRLWQKDPKIAEGLRSLGADKVIAQFEKNSSTLEKNEKRQYARDATFLLNAAVDGRPDLRKEYLAKLEDKKSREMDGLYSRLLLSESEKTPEYFKKVAGIIQNATDAEVVSQASGSLAYTFFDDDTKPIPGLSKAAMASTAKMALDVSLKEKSKDPNYLMSGLAPFLTSLKPEDREAYKLKLLASYRGPQDFDIGSALRKVFPADTSVKEALLKAEIQYKTTQQNGLAPTIGEVPYPTNHQLQNAALEQSLKQAQYKLMIDTHKAQNQMALEQLKTNSILQGDSSGGSVGKSNAELLKQYSSSLNDKAFK